MKKGVLRNFTKSTGKHVFSYGFCEISKNNFFAEYLWTTASVDSEAAFQNISECLLPKPVRYQSKILKFVC